MTTSDDDDRTPFERVDFSPESVNEADKFVRAALETVIATLEDELKWLSELKRTNDSNRGSIVIALANQYRDAAGFQNRWDLREKK